MLYFKEVFTALISFSGSLPTKIVFNSQSCMTRSTFIDLNSNKHNQGLHLCPFMISLDVVEFVILMVIYQVQYLSQIKRKT